MTGTKVLGNETVVAAGAVLLAVLAGLVATSNGAAALAIPVVIAGGIVLFARPVIGLLLFAAMIPVEAAVMVGGRSLAALIGMAIFAVWALQKVVRREPLLPLVSSGLIHLVFLLLAFACLSLLWSQHPNAGVRGIVVLAQLTLLAVLVLDLTSSWDRVMWVARMLVLAGTAAALLTLEQYFLGGARRAGEGVTGGLNRTAMTFVTILPFAFCLFRSQSHLMWRLLGLFYISISAVAVVTTFSRMNYLLFPLVVGIMVLFMTKTVTGRRQVVLLGSMALLTVSFIPMEALQERVETISPYVTQTVGPQQAEETYSARGYLMRLGIAMFKDRPIIGSGFGSYRPQVAEYQWEVGGSPYGYLTTRSPHSSHVYFLAGLGIVGFSMWLGLFLVAGGYAVRSWRSVRAGPQAHLHLVQAIGIAVFLQIIYGLYGEIHSDKIVWLILGLSVAVRTLGRNEESPEGVELRATPGLTGRAA